MSPARTVSARGTTVLVTLLATMAVAPHSGRGNAVVVSFRQLDAEGASSHVIARGADGVRMAAERVVLVPYWDPATKRAHVLVHAWYDLVSDRPQALVPVGYPEVKGSYQRFFATEDAGGEDVLRTEQPTIWRLAARVDGQRLAVREHPGVGRYRRWFAFNLSLPARRPVRLHVHYLARIGRGLELDYQNPAELDVVMEEGQPRTVYGPRLSHSARYWIDYVLHTGSGWSGPIGRGEVVLFADGRPHPLRSFVNLRPTIKDDLTVQLDLGDVALPRGGDGRDPYKSFTGTDVVRTLRLVQQSSHLPAEPEDSLGALAVDGDPDTAWVSASRQGVGAWLQIPADPGRALTTLRVTSVQHPGVSRPARVEVRCLDEHRGAVRSRVLVTVPLPDAVGPHAIPAGSTRGCAAVRLTALALHGGTALPVGLAEVEQQYATPAVGAPAWVKVVPASSRTGAQAPPAVQGAQPAKLPPAQLAWGQEVARIVDVQWSADGTLVHYLRWQENEQHDPWALLLGEIVEVATGRVLHRYQVDQAGTLPGPERALWSRAKTYLEGAVLLQRHGFAVGRMQRLPPAGGVTVGTPTLRATLTPECGRLQVRPGPSGFTWWYEPNRHSRVQARTPGQLELVLAPRVGRARSLTLRRPDLDHAFARQHAQVRDRRRQRVATLVKEEVERLELVRGKPLDSRPDAAVVHAGLFPRVHAHGGEVTLHWAPRGQAVVAVWTDVRELTSLRPDSLIKLNRQWSFDRSLIPAPWERLDYARSRVAVTVHALGPASRGDAPTR